jgi:hypothetical protein
MAQLITAAAAAALLSALAMGCSKTPEPEGSVSPAREPSSKAASPTDTTGAAAKPTQAAPTDLGWDVPAAWQKAENPNAMRKATFKIPRAAGDTEDGEMSVSQAGGSVDANVQRWVGQFQTKGPEAVKRTPRTVNGLNVTVVEIRGVFAGGGMPGGPPSEPKPSYALFGAIVEAGPTAWFFKLTGPEKTLDAAKGDFDRFVDSLRAK